jgi:hypothetical protein
MFVLAVMTMLCTGGIAFCLRFLAALSRDVKSQSIGYRVNRRVKSSDKVESEPYKPPMARAA